MKAERQHQDMQSRTIEPVLQKYSQGAYMVDNRNASQMQLMNMIQRAGVEDEELQMKPVTQLQSEDEELLQGKFEAIQQKSNNTGLPDNLKLGVENMSGFSMDDVRVHYNSDKPVQIQAHAYTQGIDIHVASGQEQHLPHEAWHVVQQKQGRVQPTMQLQGVGVNNEIALEREADVMGGEAVQKYNICKSYPGKLGMVRNSAIQRLLSIKRQNIDNRSLSDLLKSKYTITIEACNFVKYQLEQLIKSKSKYDFDDMRHFYEYTDSLIGLYNEEAPLHILIGIPYRDDCFGAAILNDLIKVRGSTKIHTIPIDDGVLPKNIHALYISGGPYSPPGTLKIDNTPMPEYAGGRKDKRLYRIPGPDRQDSRIERHVREWGLIRQAMTAGLPILGMCGGSWRLAQVLGASLMLMEDTSIHSRAMDSLTDSDSFHSMGLVGGTMTHRMMEMGEVIETTVNSAHWLKILFEDVPVVRISARCGEIVEAFEILGRCHFPIIGMQSHFEYSSFLNGFQSHLNFMRNFGQFAVCFDQGNKPIPKSLTLSVPKGGLDTPNFSQLMGLLYHLSFLEPSEVPEKAFETSEHPLFGDCVRIELEGKVYELFYSEVIGDGNCLYNTLIVLGANNGNNVQDLRNITLQHNGEEGIDEMGAYATDMDITAIARALHIQITVVFFSLNNQVLQTTKFGDGEGIMYHIAFITGGHYTPLRLVQAQEFGEDETPQATGGK